MQSVTLYIQSVTVYSVYKVPVMRVWHQMDSTGHGRDVSAARPQRSVRCPVPRTGAALGPARALRPDDLAAAASAIQRPAPQSVHTAELCPTLTLLTTCCRDSGPPVSHCTVQCTIHTLYCTVTVQQHAAHHSQSVSNTAPVKTYATLRAVKYFSHDKWNIFVFVLRNF